MIRSSGPFRTFAYTLAGILGFIAVIEFVGMVACGWWRL